MDLRRKCQNAEVLRRSVHNGTDHTSTLPCSSTADDDDDDNDDSEYSSSQRYLKNDDDDDDNSQLGGPRNSDSWWGKSRDACGMFVNQKHIQYFLAFLIFLNALVLGMLTLDTIQTNRRLERGLEYLDLSILIVFSLEVLLQFVYLGFFQFCCHGWFVFDLAVVVVSWAFMGSNIVVLRSLRVFRLLLVIKQWQSLRDLFRAVGKVLPKMFSILVVVLVFFYIFSVLFTTLYQDLYEDEYLDADYFGRLDWTFLTLFQFSTLDSWSLVTRQVMEAYPWAWVGFVAWIVITAFFLLNMIIAVICQSLHEIREAQEIRRHRKMMRSQRNMFTTQRDEVIRETQTVIQLQKELLRNQTQMQHTLNALVLALLSDSNANSGGKNGLKGLLESFSDEEIDNDEDRKVSGARAAVNERNEDKDEKPSVGQDDSSPDTTSNDERRAVKKSPPSSDPGKPHNGAA